MAALAVAGWFGASQVATARAESAVIGLLDELGLRESTTWQSLSANPLGKVTLQGVTLESPDGSQAFVLDQLVVSNIANTPDRQRGKVQLQGVQGLDGNSPLADLGLVHAGGTNRLPPMDMSVAWGVVATSGDGRVSLRVDQPEVIRAEVDVVLTGLGPLMAALRENGASAETWGVLGPGDFLAMLESVALVDGRVQMLDQGHVARSIALHERHAYGMDPAGASPARQSDEAFQRAIEEGRAECADAFGQFGAASNCEAVLAFVSGEATSITVQVNPATPVMLATVVPLWVMGSRQTVMRQLNVTIRH